jgi:hypothetical protein
MENGMLVGGGVGFISSAHVTPKVLSLVETDGRPLPMHLEAPRWLHREGFANLRGRLSSANLVE